MKFFYLLIALFLSFNVFSQDVIMVNGTFNRCAPDRFFDSGGSGSNSQYSPNENYVTTICAEDSGDFIILNFTAFNTQINTDILTIYDGPDTSSPIIGSYSGGTTTGPGTVSASSSNTSGCLTLKFVSNGSGEGLGFEADILCAQPCQDITASIDSTVPAATSGVVTVLPGASVTFNGSAVFSEDGTGATYSWNFADGNPVAIGQSVTHTFVNPGTYNVVLTVLDTNPQGCSDTATIPVLVLQDIITINNNAHPESTYSPQQLVEEVLVSGGCSAVNNFSFQVKGNPSQTQTKSYGYFTKGGAVNFPFENGIVLTSGNAYGGGNVINGQIVDYDNNLPGDADLEAALGFSNTNDATFIKFNFVPTSNTISFRYIMASEEYGDFECIFTDGFAFLLREVGTTAYTNLAVLPNGDTVSVININNSTGCAANTNYFEGYNMPGPNGINDTNYGGRTKVLTAFANVTLGATYEIKLVVADQDDHLYDSAIFLEAGSFVLGGELGEDITIASGTAQCNGDSVILDTQAPNATHTWYLDGEVIQGETGSVINVIESGTYSVDVFFAAGCETNDSVYVEFYPDIAIGSTQDLFVCNGGAAPYIFDLTENDALILGGVTGTENYDITYHTSQADADGDINSIANPDIYSGTNGQTIYARLEYQTSGCYNTASFTLNIISQPTINPVSDLTVCDDVSNNGTEQFDLESQTTTIIGAQPSTNFNVSYFASFEDADSNSNALVSPYTNTINPQPIFVRLESIGNENCTTVSSTAVFNLKVNDRALAIQPNDLFVCENANTIGIGEFNLLQQTATILGNQSANDYSVQYYESELDAESANNPISNPESFTNYSNPQTIYVRVFENTTFDCYGMTSFQLVVNPLPTLFDPTPLQVCDDNVPDGFTAIDLSLKDNEITGNNPAYTVSYHIDPSDAASGDSPLALPYTNTTNPQTVYARVEDTVTGCHDTTTLSVQVQQAPIAYVPDALEYCDPNNDGFGEFVLTDAQAQVTGGVGSLFVSYHETMANAQNNANPISLSVPYENIVAYAQTLYVRVSDPAIATDCATIVPLGLIVLATPVVPMDIADYAICDTGRDGTAPFDLTTKDMEILGGQDPSQYALTYHLSLSDAESGTGAIVNVGNYTNTTTPQTIYVRLEGANGCYRTGEFELIVNLAPLAVVPTELSLCDDALADEMTSFDLTVKDGEITGGDGSLSVGYYTTSADAQSDSNAIDPATGYTNMSVNGNAANPQTLYVRVTDTATGCPSFTTLTVRVLPNPTPRADAPDLILCDDTNTGDGVEVFDLTSNSGHILDGALGVTATYHETLGDAQQDMGAIADPVNYTNLNTDFTAQTIYVRVANDLTGCYAVVDFDILVNPLPDVVAVSDYILCEVDTDGRGQFDLSSRDGEVLNGQDPLRFTVTYHVSATAADNLTGALLSPYTNTSNPQTIYVAITDNVTGCSISTQSFRLEVDNGAEANSNGVPIEQVVCDTLGANDGLAQFDLTDNDPAVLDGQSVTDFTVSYYATESGAEQGTDPIPNIYENISNPQVIYVRVDNDEPDAAGMDSSICYAVTSLTLRVELLPIFDLEDSYTLCVDTNGTEVIAPPFLDTGLPPTGYGFEWSLDGTVLPDGTGPSLAAVQPGTYSVVVTNLATQCTSTDSTEVVVSAPPTVVVEVATQAFSEDQVIVASATGEGDYEYSLDGGAWQESGTFVEVSFGEHTVTARDTNGCGLADGKVTVVDYPHFFTPNGDGWNERWNIVGFAERSDAKIYIFDRFGKLLKQISPSGTGWNGTYNGRPLPTDDYWFTVEYTEDGQDKQFRANFTLKR